MRIPLQNKGKRSRVAALFQGEAKGRVADAAAKHRSIRQKPRCSRRGFDRQAKERAARLLLSSMSQQKQRPPRRLGPQAEPPTFRQPETCRIAAHLQNDDRKDPTCQCRLSQPQRLLKFSGGCMQETLRLQTEIPEADRIGQTRFHRRHRIADPKHYGATSRYILIPLSEPRGESKSKPRSGTSIAKRQRTDLSQRISRNTAFERLIKCRNAGLERPSLLRAGLRPPSISRHRLMRRRSQSWHRLTFQSGNSFTQGKKRLPRHGCFGHDVNS
ncbi:hypothetical protein CPY51_26100 [Rhizobium tubonense]|uniref:Uncharacterized protein n=1 Tax=Rhizobium tubonense TaxID=484088 RepID=A0A2W4CWT8_9HYPH|nr:hypothetical protein CPY51_26100 [Rhizobium tubonense]